MSDEFIAAGRIVDFPDGKLRKGEIAMEDVVVANIEGRRYTISDCCTHRGASLAEGELEGTVVVCP
jgi:3-phenylpropionate/trans-cinnamate dioxygenase ferredoxin subunit